MSGQTREEGSESPPVISLIEEFLSKGHQQGPLRTSKEEKERQNEELLNEMSDVRSTDGDFSVDVTPKRASGASCFIDASSLYDDTEYSSMTSASCSSRDSRQEMEKRQGYFIFKNSINQFSGHPISQTKDEEDFEIVEYTDVNQTPQNSLAYVPDDEGRVEGPAPIFMPRKKNLEVAPIVSGGVPPADLKKIESPSLRRRTEMCPILSGGSVDVEETPVKPKKRSSSVSSASWIVDFSDCKREPKPSLNYFAVAEDRKHDENPKSLQLIKSTGFFIDLSETTGSVPEKKAEKTETKEDKKNIFSMFIDFDDKTTTKKPRSAPRLSSSYRAPEDQKCKELVEVKTSEEIAESPSCSSEKPLERKRQIDAEINETFDKSSVCSLTDGILSKDLSPVSATDEPTYQRDSDGSLIPVREELTSEMQSAMESITAAAELQKQLLETPTDQKKAEFVKLSDLDKPTFRNFKEFEGINSGGGGGGGGGNSRKMSSSAGSRKLTIEEGAETTMLNLLASSVENSRSLSRLFPHLNDVFSKSLPNDVDLNNYRNFGYLSDVVQSDLSLTTTTSSVTSDLNSPDESSISCRQPRRLGEDLLKMFLQEIATDIIVEVGNRKMRAHKCILRSRCQYFAAILAGNWIQNSGNVISLPGYSYAAVHFALCHIYSGASYPPQGISLMELASLSDLLGLEGLKEVTTYALKINYCHNFHKPCSGCIEGVMQVFPVTLNHGLDDLYRKCLKWSCKYYTKVWPTRSFALLPTDLIYRCRQQILAHMNSESVLNTIIDCEQMVSVLELSRWAVVVENVVREILESACIYIADHFSNLLASDSFLSLGHGKSWAIQHLETLLLRTASTLTPDQACKSYPRAVRLNTLLTVPNSLSFDNGDPKINDDGSLNWSEEFIKLISAILSATEQCLIRQCSRAIRCSSFQRIDPNLRSKIVKLSCVTDVIEDKKLNIRKATQNYQMLSQQSRDSGLNQIRLAIQAHNNKRTGAAPLQPSQSAAAVVAKGSGVPKMGTAKVRNSNRNYQQSEHPVIPLQKAASTTHAPVIERVQYLNGSAGSSRKGSAGPSDKRNGSSNLSHSNSSLHKTRLSEVKPRYLEPRRVIQQQDSNVSSRTASPSMARKKMAESKVSHDSNISLDSLSSVNIKKSVVSSRNTSKESLAKQKENIATNGHVKKGSGSSSHSSSIATNSRLSAVRNTSNAKAKSSDSSPNAPKSFFTQRSRNILLKRTQEEKRQEETISQIPSARERNKMRAQLGIRPEPIKLNPKKVETTKEKNLKNLAKKKQLTASKPKEEEEQEVAPEPEQLTYSRLERSSTFCKEVSDNPDLTMVQID